MAYKKISDSLSSVLKDSVKGAHTSFTSIAKQVKKMNLEKGESNLVNKTLRKLNEDPSSVSRGMGKKAMQSLGKAKYLRSKYEANPSQALRKVQGASSEAEIQESPELKKRMWARAQFERREAEAKQGIRRSKSQGSVASRPGSPATRSLGLEEWQSSAVSAAQVEKQRAAKRKAAAAKEASEEVSESQVVTDLMID